MARLDIVGVVTLAMVRGLGGGIIRDILLGALPPATFSDWRYLAVAAAGGLAAFALTRATAAELSADSSKAGLAAPARAVNSAPASDAATAAAEPSAGSPSGGTGKTSSPGTSRRSLLVARMRTRRQRPSSSVTRLAAASRT